MLLTVQLNVVTALIILIIVFTIPSFRSLVKGNWRKKAGHDQALYEDKDGIASPGSTAKFSNKLQYIIIFALNSIGFGLSIANVVYTIVKENSGTASRHSPLGSYVLLIPAWCLLLLQLIDASVQPAPVVRFKATIAKLVSCFLLGGMIWVSLLGDVDIVATTLTSLQMGAIVGLIATIASLRRRPKLFRPNGHIVDQEMNVSLWSRYSFQWCVDALAVASKEKFENSDVPAISHDRKSEVVVERFKNIVIKDNMPLWFQIFWAFKGPLFLQWGSILLSNFSDVAPAFAVLQLLQYLETRTDPNALETGAWKYVVGIAAATTASHMVDSRIMWWSKSNIVVPLRSILTGLMYDKLLKIHSSSEPSEKESSKADDIRVDHAKNSDQQQQAASQQDVVNMFAVDCLEIANFGESNTEYINVAGKLVITVVFLLLLIGWQSLCAGLIGIAVLFPINKVLSERYGKKQKTLMEIRDKRTKMTTEALLGIRQIKFSASESQWAEKLEAVREEELSTLWKTRLDNLYMSIASEFTPVALTALSLGTYSLVHGTLLPSVAFTAISLFIQLEGIVTYIPYLTVAAINAKVSCDRIQNFLRLPEKPENTVPGDSISFHNATVTFPHDTADPKFDRFTLRGLDLQFPNNALSVISGPTGAGKSLLLAAILGEVDVVAGYIQVPRFSSQRYDSKATAADWIIPNALSFVSQTPWIENATIKDNITFGLPFDPIRYQKVIEACALTHDLAILEDGDETEVGAQGISLSGGQKWRLTLARAFYSRAGILILDDVFSALDAHVGKHIYENAVMGELAEGRTRILATHHTSLCLPRAKYAVHLSARGEIEHAGTIEQLRQEDVLDDILKADDTTESTFIEEDEVLQGDAIDSAAVVLPKDVPVAAKAAPKKLIEDERRETGRVKTSVYAGYLQASGGLLFWLFLVSLYLVSETFTVGRTYWVRIWASDYGEKQPTPVVSFLTSHYQNTIQPRFSNQQPIHPLRFAGSMNSTSVSTSFPIEVQNRSLWFYLAVYCLISIISVILSICRLYLVYNGSIKASRRIFKSTLHGVLRAPLRWLDTVPMGRILNRFTGDFTTLDSSLASDFSVFAQLAMSLCAILVTATFVSPFIIICALILLAACASFALKFIAAARNMKRLYSTNKSPLISHFAASLSGVTTIRAFDKSSEFRDRMSALLDTYAACSWYDSLFKSWLGLRIGITASLFSAAVAAFVVTQRGIDASLAGFVLSFALSFGWCVSRTIRLVTQLELDMNAAERIFEYRDLTTEVQTGEEVPASWPKEGKLEIKDLEIGYAEGLPSVLKGLTFTAEKNQRIGVIGRTGAGKSTLSLALFRFLQARKGSITIDGIDISKIKLYDLRTRLAIIPQDPVLFSGTIRSNLDPFDEFSDYQLNEALMRVHLIASSTPTPIPIPNPASSAASTLTNTPENKNIFLSLSAPIASGGSNLSQGQKQLLCLARAILSRPKVLLLDEATSAVDMSTDLLIQRSIRDEFTDTTLLVIAHRLSTIADFDRILVIKDGVNAEFGSPKELLEKGDGLFRGMVEQSGEKDELERIVKENSR